MTNDDLDSDNSLDELPGDYLEFTLNILDDRLEGEINEPDQFFFTVFLQHDILKSGLTLEKLMDSVRNQNVTGTLRYPSGIGSVYSGKTTEIKFEIVNHRGKDEIYMKSTLGYFLWEYINLQKDKISFAIYWWYCPPASKEDLNILEMAKSLLVNPENWHQKDDRKCEPDIENNHWSLFCALKFASIETTGEYNHHNTAIQTARFVIDDLIPDHGYMHTLMDYNNAPSTTHKDIIIILDLAIEQIKNELER